MAAADGRYYIGTHDTASDGASPRKERLTDGYVLLWEDHGEIRIEGAVAPELAQRLLASAVGNTLKDRLPGFLRGK